MASTMRFRQTDTSARQRSLVSEDSFAKGIRVSDAPQDAAYARMLVNYKLKNEGTVLATRPAIAVSDAVGNTLESELTSVLFTGSVECEIANSEDTVIKKYTVVERADGYATLYIESGVPSDAAQAHAFKPVQCSCTSNFKICKAAYTRTGEAKHDMTISADAVHINAPVQSKLNTSAIVAYEVDGSAKLGKLKVIFTDSTLTAATWTIEDIVVSDVSPSQAVNYGYNMLKPDPYTFDNVEMTSGAVTLLGILPYDANTGKLMLTAKLGTSIKFKLVYKYPAADKANSKERYYTSWELYDLSSASGSTTVIQAETASPLVVPGDEISITHTPAIKSFGVVVKIYRLTDISTDGSITTTTQLKSKLESMSTYVAPVQVITLASYYLTNDEANARANNLELMRYDIAKAQGMCAWQNRLVAWGVKGAEHLLFVSDINNPGYFPYPNGVEVFDNVIIKAVPYLDKLLVFTTDSLYMITSDTTGLTYTVRKVQDRLALSHVDDASIVPVLNMVHFKSGNYYYMIVPKLQSLTGELQLAPISRPIEEFLDNFTESVATLLNTVYNVEYDTFELLDAYTYVADNNVNNVYKVICKAGEVTDVVNLILRYDTSIRAWTVWAYGAGMSNDRLYEVTATGDVRYVSCKDNALTVLREDASSAKDMFYEHFPNYQYIDTGFRSHAEQLKKRYREVQFAINSLQDVPIAFNTAFNVDADERKSFYKHVVTYCTDPNDPHYGNIIVQRELDDSSVTPTLTELDGAWTLDSSQFPELSVYKVRYKVSGKGYGGRVQILCRAQCTYELLYIAWVFRTMNAR